MKLMPDSHDLHTGSTSAAPKKRLKLILWLMGITAVSLAAASGLGYYAWTMRGDTQRDRDELEKLRWQDDACTKELGELRTANTELTRQVGGCETVRDQAEKARESTESNLSATREELEELRKQRAETEKRLAAFKDLTARFQQMIDAGKLEVSVRNGSMLLELPAEILFPSGSAELSRPGEMALMEVAIVLKQFPDRRFMIVGHTDNQPVRGGRYRSNWELSTARAVHVTQFLVDAGLPARNLVAAGHGEHDPVAKNNTDKNREKNRRIEIVLVPDLAEMPRLPEDPAGEGG
jgi:chemotaxis protein MotB